MSTRDEGGGGGGGGGGSGRRMRMRTRIEPGDEEGQWGGCGEEEDEEEDGWTTKEDRRQSELGVYRASVPFTNSFHCLQNLSQVHCFFAPF